MSLLPLFSCKDLSIVVSGQTILDSISLDIFKGDHVAITGPSGCGKSTLLRTLLGFLEPTSGSVSFDGNIVTIKNLSKLRKCVGTLFQEQRLSGETVREALLYPFSFHYNKNCRPTDDRICKEILNAGLAIDILDNSLDKISGGEKQRIALVRSLLLDRTIIFADEPTSALDKKNRDLLTSILLSESRTVLVVTHDEELANCCSRIIKLEDGKISSEVNNADN